MLARALIQGGLMNEEVAGAAVNAYAEALQADYNSGFASKLGLLEHDRWGVRGAHWAAKASWVGGCRRLATAGLRGSGSGGLCEVGGMCCWRVGLVKVCVGRPIPGAETAIVEGAWVVSWAAAANWLGGRSPPS